ncbi:MAG: hypothetical protein ABJA67_04870 [Chthonomonadales bacterium]
MLTPESVQTQSAASQFRPLIISLVILAGAAFWTYKIGMQANNLEHELYHSTEHVGSLTRTIAKMEAEPASTTPPNGAIKPEKGAAK